MGNKFKTGDKVKVYGASQLGDIKGLDQGCKGIISTKCYGHDDWYNIELDGDKGNWTFHEKQLRRLKKVKTEPLRTIFITAQSIRTLDAKGKIAGCFVASKKILHSEVEFVEVRRQK